MLCLLILLVMIIYSNQQYSCNNGCNTVPEVSGGCDAGCVLDTQGSTGNFCCPCSPGWYCPGGNNAMECPAGTYNPNAGSTSLSDCTSCPAGTYSSYPATASLSDCISCPAGTYNPKAGSTSLSDCTTCPAGTYNPNPASTSSSSCAPCTAGKYSTAGQGVCTSCSPGKYSTNSSSISCTTCPIGFVNTNTGSNTSLVCTICPAGSYTSNDQSSCLLCNTGTYNPNNGSTSSTSCIPCSAGTYNPYAGQPSCQTCDAGYYSSHEASVLCTSCSPGTYNPNVRSNSSASCIPCPPGTYYPSFGSSLCIQCLPNTYNPNNGSISYSQCQTCPPNLPVSVAGSSVCSKEILPFQCTISSTSSSGNIGNIPLYCMILFAGVGGIIYYIRSMSSDLEVISVSSIALNTSLLGLDLVSDFIFVILLLQGAFLKLTGGVKFAGVLFLLSRFIHPFSVILTMGSLFGINICNINHFAYLDTTHWKEYSTLYACLVLLTTLESSFIKYLPWLSSSFCKASGGYPDLFSFRICSYGKLCQSLISVLIQASVLLSINRSAFSSSCEFILVVSLASSVIPLFIQGAEVLFQATTLVDHQKRIDAINVTNRNTSDMDYTNNPVTDIESKTIGSSRLSSSPSRVTRRISITGPSTSSATSTLDDYMIELPTGSMSSLAFQQEILRYYRNVAPAMVNSINDIMKEYRGDEELLINTLRATYKKPVLSYTITLSTRSVSSLDFYQALYKYFEVLAPDQVDSIDRLMIEYRDNEQALVDSITKTYSKPIRFVKL